MELVFKKEEKSQDLKKPIDYHHFYELVILGGGPAALTAALYGLRKGLDIALVTNDIGGQVLKTWYLENYMGFLKVDGYELIKKFEKQVVQFPIALEEGLRALSVKKKDFIEVELDNNQTLKGKTLIIATGKKSKEIGVPGERDFTGKGVCYCATCDAPLYKDKKTLVVGGANSGVESALELSKISSKVYLTEFLDKLQADQILINKLNNATNVTILLKHKVKEIQGEKFVNRVILENTDSGKENILDTDGIFVEIGLIPNTDFLKSSDIKLNQSKEIIINEKCETNQKGIFAAGDVTDVPEKQVIIACGEGAKACLSVYKYLQYLD